jgi:hypothetical protein
MNHQEIFKTWKRHREQIKVSHDFSASVMARIRESRATHRAWISLLGPWAVRPWARAAMIAMGVSIGLARIVMTLQLVLFA